MKRLFLPLIVVYSGTDGRERGTQNQPKRAPWGQWNDLFGWPTKRSEQSFGKAALNFGTQHFPYSPRPISQPTHLCVTTCDTRPKNIIIWWTKGATHISLRCGVVTYNLLGQMEFSDRKDVL